ncbi:hypothetical protein LDO26_00835 [Luteimonas sp. BDR2-5]|uniref:hypothetical protein n=1 Tax=Proluteimonas luteida TaxID=2878685 RepID=UPI001E566E0D|nr:hypothetical protein [Luteimonas sp. BDR2-5]MCD9026760.1 hypothetical protein [Luteimonas sp. BDR2-5]
MLRAVLDGGTYARVGQAHGVTRTAVERRIKELVRSVSQSVGIDGLSDGGIAFVSRLRSNREAILLALGDFDLDQAIRPRADKPIRTYSTEEVVAAAGRVRAYSRQPLRDVALFLVLFATGARPLEIARLRVRDFLHADGSVREASELPAAAAISGVPRPLYFRSTRLNTVLLQYLGERATGGARASTGTYLGLDPDQALFLAADGEGFAITAYAQGRQQRYLCRPILETYRKIFRHAGLPGASPLAVRATVAARLYARCADERQVGQLLGISQRSRIRRLFPRRRPSAAELTVDLI